MRIVVLCAEFAPGMGYLMNLLPKYLARTGADVHVLTLGLPPYTSARKTAEFRTAQNAGAGQSYSLNGFHVHVMACGSIGRWPYARGLRRHLAELKPDIVYSLLAIGALPVQAALLAKRMNYKLFTGNHTSAEAFPMARNPPEWWTRARVKAFATRWVSGRIVSLATEACYCRTDECGEIAWRFYGVERHKIKVVRLGVDTDFFFPRTSTESDTKRQALRAELGFTPEEIVCINSGRMSAHKDLGLLVKALNSLRAEGLAFRCLFIGDGPERPVLTAAAGNVVLQQRPYSELGEFYRAADIGVWPAGESTSMFDAAACGLPLVVCDGIDAHLDGNGLAFATHDLAALTDSLRKLANPETRARLGARGAQLTREKQAMQVIADVRLHDFADALAEERRG